jgi:hypothetical protein
LIWGFVIVGSVRFGPSSLAILAFGTVEMLDTINLLLMRLAILGLVPLVAIG